MSPRDCIANITARLHSDGGRWQHSDGGRWQHTERRRALEQRPSSVRLGRGCRLHTTSAQRTSPRLRYAQIYYGYYVLSLTGLHPHCAHVFIVSTNLFSPQDTLHDALCLLRALHVLRISVADTSAPGRPRFANERNWVEFIPWRSRARYRRSGASR